jgi:hypothetical protein
MHLNRSSSTWTLAALCAYDNQLYVSNMHVILVTILWLGGGK